MCIHFFAHRAAPRAPSSSVIACLQDDAAGDQARREPQRQHSGQPLDPAAGVAAGWGRLATGQAAPAGRRGRAPAQVEVAVLDLRAGGLPASYPPV